MMEKSNLRGLETLRKIIEIKCLEEISLYDKGWIAVYFLETENENLEFFKSLKNEIVDILTNKEKVSKVFLNLEEIIGLFLGVYSLLRLKKFNEEFIITTKGLIEHLKKLEWLEYDGELIFSISLLQTNMDLKLNLKEIFEKSFERNANNIDKLRAKIYAFLTFSQRKFRKTYYEVVEDLLKELTTKKTIEMIKSDIELSTLFGIGLTNLLEYDRFNGKIKEIRDELFKASYLEIVKLIENPQLITKIIEIASLMRETGKVKIDRELEDIVKISNKELKINLEKLPSPSLKLDLLSKFLILGSKAGFDKPYFLSKKEYDVYLQIKNEIKGYRRIRKRELVALLFCLDCFIWGFTVYTLTQFQPIFHAIIYSIPLIPVLYGISYQVYRKGHISLKEMWEELLKLLRR